MEFFQPPPAKAKSSAQRREDAMAEKEPLHKAVLVFSAPHVKDLVSEKVRLPPNYVGVRRIRPSSLKVQNELRGSPVVALKKQEVVFKVTDANGVERRMNAQEKKRLKLKLKEERAEEKKRLKREALEAKTNTELPPTPQLQPHNLPEQEGYHQLKVNQSALEEELADLRGDRVGVPPVMLSPPLAIQALQSGFLASSRVEETEQPRIVLDDELAKRWAKSLKNNMKSAEEVRERDSIRAMPYQLVPEVWSRLRPTTLADEPDREGTAIRTENGAGDNTKLSSNAENGAGNDTESLINTVWSFTTVRRKRGSVDTDTDAVISLLYRQSNLHISCGAKFGCDFLLYDGRRDQRHAFAGLRIIERTSCSQLPLPSPYDLAGYVRCLNTAGKLALLATVEEDESGDAHIAFVDLALEKILQQGERKRSRRDAGKNLDKHAAK